MNFLILAVAFVGCAAAQILPYRPPVVVQFAPAPQGSSRSAKILSQTQNINPDGSFESSFETENGISASQEGKPKSVPGSSEPAIAVKGQFAYSESGSPYRLSYVADENGYQPQADYLPTPPPIPVAIARALEYIAAHPQPQEPSSQFPQRRYK